MVHSSISASTVVGPATRPPPMAETPGEAGAEFCLIGDDGAVIPLLCGAGTCKGNMGIKKELKKTEKKRREERENINQTKQFGARVLLSLGPFFNPLFWPRCSESRGRRGEIR